MLQVDGIYIREEFKYIKLFNMITVKKGHYLYKTAMIYFHSIVSAIFSCHLRDVSLIYLYYLNNVTRNRDFIERMGAVLKAKMSSQILCLL